MQDQCQIQLAPLGCPASSLCLASASACANTTTSPHLHRHTIAEATKQAHAQHPYPFTQLLPPRTSHRDLGAVR
ncbi:hypothetical protein BDU57DRAFT_511761 [Ampelomyces quisqualis]|uniref:Uncharacterized protein n=1 Tax=Ampelomyces quisqualis TaxID=50730 RepID=A0A6A5QT57_AMPQU|nr:hypothetical protein BDU57DRAFT_511761 [Ampelomyces quisqualis]